jgi:dTDP-4-dehydrorhamnose reductase
MLITGASGLLGAHVAAALSLDHHVVGIDRHRWWGERPIEMLNGDLLADAFVTETVRRVAPSVVVHCAAMVDVDACERQPELAEAYNAHMTRTLVRAAGPEALFVYITTDGIFQGDAPFRTERDEPKPRTVYGWSKLHGEQEVQAAGGNHLIIRTNFFGWSSGRKKTSAEWLYRALSDGEPITGFTDFHFTPIYVVDFVDRLTQLMASPHRGLFHLCGGERVSKYDFARLMAAAAGLQTTSLRPGSIDGAGLLAPRPKDMSLSCERFSKALGVSVPDCAGGLARFIADRSRPLEQRFAHAHR